ncbi:uncharacterized protein LOC130637041 [Hydractinia symbiolongicarpus]|uniref:uncharacterized protein LOC130637041 n=1 Tax=Hydractinia symbiolongicarpus TaxID=13093 RepID=UPI00254D10C8|nr:uncharacterized protein LOC130637041 [Hydractinia symbiolongicarpus]
MDNARYNSLVIHKLTTPLENDLIIQVILFISLSMLIVISNVVLIIGLYKTKQTRGKINKLFIALSITDINVGILTVPIMVSFILLQHSGTQYLVLNILARIPPVCSICLTLSLAMDRCITIIYNKNLSLSILIVCSFVSTVIMSLPDTLTLVLRRIPVTIYANEWVDNLLLAFGVGFCVVMLVLNCRILYFIKKKTTQISMHTIIPSNYRKKTVKTIILIMVSQNLTYVLYLCGRCIMAFAIQRDVDKVCVRGLYFSSLLIMFSNSFINTLIVIGRNQKVLMHYKDFIWSGRNTRSDMIESRGNKVQSSSQM